MIRMAFGKYKGKPLSEIPSGYLTWLLTLDDLADWLQQAVRVEVLMRGSEGRYRTTRIDPDPDSVPKELVPLIEKIVRSGYRSQALKLHPDHGGSSDDMRLLIEAYEWLDRKLSPDRNGRKSAA